MSRPTRRALLLAALPTALALPAVAQSFSEAQRAEIVEILRRALADDPSILREALTSLDAADRNARTAAQRDALSRHAEAVFRDPMDPSRGNPRGDVVIVEFFDPRCTYCKQMHPAMDALLRRDTNLRVVMKDLPILGPTSVVASRALLAAHRQGRYPQFYDALLTLRVEPSEPVLRQQAERVGLDWARLRRDMEDPAIGRRIEANIQLAQRLGVEGTPALVIAGAEGAGPPRMVPGAVDLPTLERMVAEARATR